MRTFLITLILLNHAFAQDFEFRPKIILSFKDGNKKITLDNGSILKVDGEQLKINDSSFKLIKDGHRFHSKSIPALVLSFQELKFFKEEKTSSSRQSCSYSGMCMKCGMGRKRFDFISEPTCGFHWYADCKGFRDISHMTQTQVAHYTGTVHSEGELIGEINSIEDKVVFTKTYTKSGTCHK